MLRLDNVAMRYPGGAEVLHELNLSLPRGELLYLMGPTGAGKSSLLRLLGLLQMPCKGELILFGRNVAQLAREQQSAFRRRIGIVFQEGRLSSTCQPTKTSPCRSGYTARETTKLRRWCPRC